MKVKCRLDGVTQVYGLDAALYPGTYLIAELGGKVHELQALNGGCKLAARMRHAPYDLRGTPYLAARLRQPELQDDIIANTCGVWKACRKRSEPHPGTADVFRKSVHMLTYATDLDKERPCIPSGLVSSLSAAGYFRLAQNNVLA